MKSHTINNTQNGMMNSSILAMLRVISGKEYLNYPSNLQEIKKIKSNSLYNNPCSFPISKLKVEICNMVGDIPHFFLHCQKVTDT